MGIDNLKVRCLHRFDTTCDECSNGSACSSIGSEEADLRSSQLTGNPSVQDCDSASIGSEEAELRAQAQDWRSDFGIDDSHNDSSG